MRKVSRKLPAEKSWVSTSPAADATRKTPPVTSASASALRRETGSRAASSAAAETAAASAGYALLAAMTALALLEHLFMVLPLPDEKLWRWMLPAPGRHQDQGR